MKKLSLVLCLLTLSACSQWRSMTPAQKGAAAGIAIAAVVVAAKMGDDDMPANTAPFEWGEIHDTCRSKPECK